jgi:hypothetical protein
MDDKHGTGTATERLDGRAAIAEYLGVHPSYIPKLLKEGLPCTRLAKEFKSTRPLLDNWLAERAAKRVGIDGE